MCVNFEKEKLKMFSLTKECYTVDLTIHSLQLPAPTNDMFKVKWKRGNSKGSTSQMFQNESNEVVFEYHNSFESTLYLDSNEKSKKKKEITFKIYSINNISGETELGEITFDIAQMKDMKQITLSRYSTNTKIGKCTLLVTISLRKKGSDPMLETSPLDSKNNEFLNSINQDFFEKEETPRQVNSLASFTANPRKLRHRTSTSDISALLSLNAPDSPLSSDTKLMSGSSPLKMKKNRLSRTLFKSDVFTSHEKPSVMPTSMPIPLFDLIKAMDCFEQVFTAKFTKSPVNVNQVPRFCSALVAALEDLKVFNEITCEDSDFEIIVNNITQRFDAEKPVEDGTLFDVWYCAVCFEAVANKVFGKKKWRITTLTNAMNDFIENISNKIIEEYSNIISPYIEDVIKKSSEFEKQIREIIKQFKCIKTSTSDLQFGEYFFSLVVHLFDIKLVNAVLDNPILTTFTNAINWNSFTTQFAGEGIGTLTCFNEVAAIIMMSSTLTQNPEETTNICPHIPSDIVLRIIVNQQPDNMMPLTNDSTYFANSFRLDVNSSPKKLTLGTYHLDQIMALVNVDSWKNAKFTNEEIESNTYLKSCF